MKITYVLGAGFSKRAKLPLIDEFGSKLAEQKNNIVRRFGNTTYKEFVRVISQADSIEKGFIALSERGIIDDLHLMEKAITYILVACCESFLNSSTLFEPYRKFLLLVKNQNASIISLNQDTVLEITLDKNFHQQRKINNEQIRFDYGVPGWNKYSAIGDFKKSDVFFKFYEYSIFEITWSYKFFPLSRTRLGILC